MIVAAATGHRPNKFFRYGFDAFEWGSPIRVWIRDQLRSHLEFIKPDAAISGMAVGVDQDFAYVCCEMGVPFVAAIPFEGQESQWPEHSQQFYHELVARAYQRVIVTPGGYAAWKMQKRNEWMVDNCTVLVSVWDGTEGGTLNCLRYAWEVQRPYYHIDPSTFRRAA